MPFQECSIVSQREEFCRRAQQAGANIRELCRQFGVAPATGEVMTNLDGICETILTAGGGESSNWKPPPGIAFRDSGPDRGPGQTPQKEVGAAPLAIGTPLPETSIARLKNPARVVSALPQGEG